LYEKQQTKQMKQLMKKIILTIFIGFSLIQIQAQQCDLIDAGDDVTVDCINNCTTLNASYFVGLGATTETYSVNAALPCPIPPSGAVTPTSITTDDVWSNTINLPFDFYFFGTGYNQILVGANGVISFNLNNTSPTQQSGGYCAWQFTDPLPSTNLFKNTIFGAFHDVDVTYGGRIEYYISGTAPQRKFVVSYTNVAQFSCNSMHTTQRIVLYETANVIDVQIDRKDTCTSWNNGNAVVGIQNDARDVAVVPVGRNTGPWTVPNSAPELWRFVPTANQSTISFDTNWYNDATNALVGSGDSVNVCVTEDTTFRVEASYVDPNGQTVILIDYVTVYFNDALGSVDLGADTNQCSNVPFILDATAVNATSYEWQKDGVVIPGETSATYSATQTGIYTATAILGVCSESDEVYIHMEPIPLVDVGPDFHSCDGSTETLIANVSNLNGDETYQWFKDGIAIANAINTSLNVSETGAYSVEVTNNIDCVGTDEMQLTIDPYPDLDLGADQTVCPDDTASIVSNIDDADTYTWIVNGVTNSANTDTLTINGTGSYDVILNLDRGTCSVSDTIHIEILSPVMSVPNPIFYGELEVNASGGLPPYQYSLDESSYQSSNYFEDLPDDDYTVYIKDSNGCIYISLPVHVTNLKFPHFVTPNGDGYNDTWRIENTENTPDAIVYIYNRFGKVLKRMHTKSSEFWDGTFNGYPMPASDYWFSLTLPNGRLYKGHFSIKR